MGLKEDILSINVDDIQWEQEKIKGICKRLKVYSDTREKLEVALIHISKNETNLAKEIITELKESRWLADFVEDDSKWKFLKDIWRKIFPAKTASK